MGNSNKKTKNQNIKNEQFIKTPNDDAEELQEMEETNPINQSNTDKVLETGSITTKSGDYIIHCLTIVGQIEGHNVLPVQNKTTKYEHVIPQLVAIEEEEKIDGLLILLNTVGGDVEAGLAIAELISGMKKPTVSIVLGGGHSIGIPLAVAAKYSFIAPSASMTVHPVRSTGLILGVPQTFEYFNRMQERITTFVCSNSNIMHERYIELAMNVGELVLDVGTILEGEDAVDEGLIDDVGNLSDAMQKLKSMIGANKNIEKRQNKRRNLKNK